MAHLKWMGLYNGRSVTLEMNMFVVYDCIYKTMNNELNWDMLCILGIIYEIYEIVIYHYISSNIVLYKEHSSYKCCYYTTQNSDNLFSFKKYFVGIAKLYICILLAYIRCVFVKYYILIGHISTLTFNQFPVVFFISTYIRPIVYSFSGSLYTVYMNTSLRNTF